MNSATIETILDIRNHPNADRLDIAKIKGWHVCVKRDEFKVGDFCIYIETDSVLEDCPQYEFLRNKHFRIKAMRLRGFLSEGIAFPVSKLIEFGVNDIELIQGMDVSQLVKASHYEKPVPACLFGDAKGNLPVFIRKTDEENLENVCDVLTSELFGKPYYITTKIDGSSASYIVKDSNFMVCSRNLELKESETNAFWKIAKKYDIENKLKQYFPNRNVCVQGEIYGPGIQGNLLGMSELTFAAFNLWDIDNRTYLDYSTVVAFCSNSNIPMVPIVSVGEYFNMTFDELQKISNELKYSNGNIAEGIVVRPQTPFISEIMGKFCSFKVKNEEFKLRYE